jgi:putative ABC transport system substrate-binding protein
MHFERLKRREFITVVGSAAASWPLAARAQQPGMPVIGFLASGRADLLTDRVHAFREGLSETGLTEGRNVAIEFRWAEDQTDQLPALAADLVSRRPAVIAAAGGISARALKAATTAVPIVFWIEGDPVEVGLVASLNRPGGNLTGVTTLGAELAAKRLEVLRDAAAKVSIMGLLIDPSTLTAAALSSDLQEAARALGVELHVVHVVEEADKTSSICKASPPAKITVHWAKPTISR